MEPGECSLPGNGEGAHPAPGVCSFCVNAGLGDCFGSLLSEPNLTAELR